MQSTLFRSPPTMQLITLIYVLLIIAFAKALGELLSRVNQPAIVGELLAGIVIGPAILGRVFPALGEMYDITSEPGKFISDLADFGMLFLMLYAGLEFSGKMLRASSWLGGTIAAFGVAIPLVIGYVVGYMLDLRGLTLAFVAVAMSVTALPVTVRVLKDLEVLKTKTAGTIVSAALISDAGLLLALGIILSSVDGGASSEDMLVLTVGFIGFFAAAVLEGRYVVPHVYQLLRWMRTGEAAFAVAIGFAIAFAILADWVGLPAVIGAFIAGLLLRQTGTGLKTWVRVQDVLSAVTMGFFAPIFFVLIGFTVDFDAVADSLPLFAGVLGVAIVGKLVGSYVPARAGGLGPNESVAVASMMMGKGAMELVFARLAMETRPALIGPDLFSVLVLMAFVSTMLAPILFRIYYNRAIISNEISGKPVEQVDLDVVNL